MSAIMTSVFYTGPYKTDIVRTASNRAYICGPITGIEDLNRPAFTAAETFLRDMGLTPINPHVINPVQNKNSGHNPEIPWWHEAMRKDLKELASCGLIFMLPGYENSLGAIFEIITAWRLKIPAFDMAFLFKSGLDIEAAKAMILHPEASYIPLHIFGVGRISPTLESLQEFTFKLTSDILEKEGISAAAV